MKCPHPGTEIIAELEPGYKIRWCPTCGAFQRIDQDGEGPWIEPNDHILHLFDTELKVDIIEDASQWGHKEPVFHFHNKQMSMMIPESRVMRDGIEVVKRAKRESNKRIVSMAMSLVRACGGEVPVE